MHYYTFNIADYRKDTGHLSTLEHGIYRQLLDWYYLEEVPIPKETQTVIRRLRLGSDSDIQSLQNVLNDFFILQDDGYHQLRCDDQIEKYHDKAEVNKVNGKLGGRPKKTQSVILANPTQSESKGNETLTSNHKPQTTNQVNTNICPPGGEPAVKDGLPDCQHQSVIDLYHQHLPTLRKVEVWNAARQGYLRQRWREVAAELAGNKTIVAADVLNWWADFFQHVGKSKFLTGRIQHKDGRAFTADLEWILKPSNFAKIVEGKYHGV
jgi:uncharacterized protein YdaU (DUF1376 family)